MCLNLPYDILTNIFHQRHLLQLEAETPVGQLQYRELITKTSVFYFGCAVWCL